MSRARNPRVLTRRKSAPRDARTGRARGRRGGRPRRSQPVTDPVDGSPASQPVRLGRILPPKSGETTRRWLRRLRAAAAAERRTSPW